ncbi:putative E3 ubiquitin-protein ligase RFWD3 [Plasmopara halstedii]
MESEQSMPANTELHSANYDGENDFSGSSEDNENDVDNGYNVRWSLHVQPSPAINFVSDSVSVEPFTASEIDDDVQILTAAEAAAAAQNAVDEQKISRRRKRKRSIVNTKVQPTECTICCDDCTITGNHRLVALKCGHLFGKHCIERWICEKHTCPICNACINQTDIFFLFLNHVAVVDNSAIEDMTQKFNQEKVNTSKLEMDVAFLRQKLRRKKEKVQQLYADLTKLRKKYAEMREQQRCMEAFDYQFIQSQSTYNASVDGSPIPCRDLKRSEVACIDRQSCSHPSIVSTSQLPSKIGNLSFSAAVYKYKHLWAVSLLGARVHSIARSCRFVCVGDKQPQGSHGLLILSCQNPARGERLAVHNSEVRDICIHSSEAFALTVAFDGKMAMTCLNDQKVVLQIMLPNGRRQGWSCTFSASDPYAMYCGFQDGSVAKYDYRKPNAGNHGIVESFLLPERQPVHSIKLYKSSEGMEGLAAATFRGLSIWKNVEASPNTSVGATPFAHVPTDQACFSLASDQLHSQKVVLSERSMPTKHSVFDLHSIEIGRRAPNFEFAGHKASSVLSRSAIWSEADGTSIVSSWSQDVGSVTFWDVANHREVDGPDPKTSSRASTATPVVDIQHAVARDSWIDGTALLGTMTARQLCICRLGANL